MAGIRVGRLVAVLAAIVVVACVGAYLGRAPFLARLDPRIPRAARHGAAGLGATTLCSVDLAGYSRLALPSPTVLTVLEVALADGGRERRVVLKRPGRAPTYLGPLTRQLGPSPVETLFLDFGSGRVIVGYVDPAELYFTGGTLTGATNHKEGLGGCGNQELFGSYAGFRGFVAPLIGDRDDFDRIKRVQVGSPSEEIVDTPFDPPLDASGFWVTVP